MAASDDDMLKQMADTLRKSEEACETSTTLRGTVQRQMKDGRAQHKAAKDDTTVIVHREAARNAKLR